MPRHPAILTAGFVAVQYVAGGAFTPDEARAALLPAALDSGSAGADRALEAALQAGSKADARYVVGAPLTAPIPKLPTATEAAARLDTELRAFFDQAKTGQSTKLGIQGAAGLGKTTRALAVARKAGVTVDHYVPTQKLARELAERLPSGAAIAIRGRTHSDEGLPPLCAKADAADALQKAGLGRLHQKLLCGNPKDGRFPCPHAAGCGYHAQFKNPAPIRFYSHEWLVLGSKERAGLKTPDVAIVDESFAGVFEHYQSWSLEALGEAGGAFYTVGDAVRHGTLSQEEHGPLIAEALEAAPFPRHPPIHPEMSSAEAAQAIKRWNAAPKEKLLPYDLLRAIKSVLESGESKRLYAEEWAGKTTIRFSGLKTLASEATSWLFLDASLNPEIVRKIIPDTTVISIEARRNVRVVQITDSALSKSRLAANADHLSARLAEFAGRVKAKNPNGAVISGKGFLERAKADGYFTDLPDGHYGALRGLSTLETADWLIQVGRNEPPVWAVERKARCWFADEPTLELGTVKRDPEWLQGKDDAARINAITSFANDHCQRILESLREEESLQAIDRLRLIHAGRPKTVYLLSNQPLPGIQPDVLTTLDSLLLPGRLAVVMLRDGALTGPPMLALLHPDLFENEQSAKDALRTLQGWISLYNPSCHLDEESWPRKIGHPLK